MSSLNKVILIGHLGKDPETRRMQSGDAVVNFSLATTESWRDKATGERKDKTEWHDVVIFNENLGKVAENYLKKGSKVYIEGQLQTREWDDQQTGQKRRRTEIVLQKFRGELVLLDTKRDDQTAPQSARNDPPAASAYAQASGGRAAPVAGNGGRATLDDEIPFAPEMRG